MVSVLRSNAARQGGLGEAGSLPAWPLEDLEVIVLRGLPVVEESPSPASCGATQAEGIVAVLGAQDAVAVMLQLRVVVTLRQMLPRLRSSGGKMAESVDVPAASEENELSHLLAARD